MINPINPINPIHPSQALPEGRVVGAVLAAGEDGYAESDLPGPGIDPVAVEKRIQQGNHVLLLDAAGPLQEELPVTSIVKFEEGEQ